MLRISINDSQLGEWDLDSVEYSANQIQPGKSLQLDPSGYDYELNDGPRHWCSETNVIDLSQDFGTPGMENSGCFQ